MKQETEQPKDKSRYLLEIQFKAVINGVYKSVPAMKMPFKTKKEAVDFYNHVIDDTVLQSLLYDNSNNTCVPL